MLQKKKKNRKTEPPLTLYPRMVNSEANPVSIPINRCQIVDVKVHRHCPRVDIPRTFSTQHCFQDLPALTLILDARNDDVFPQLHQSHIPL